MANVTKIVITGGPCAGKTTSMAKLPPFLESHGIRCYIVPEAATIFFSHGVQFSDLGKDEHSLVFQTELLKLQLRLEESFVNMAKLRPEPSVVLCDRGGMDGRAYMTQALWDKMLRNLEMGEDELCNGRYDAVIHLVTAANGAAEFYTLENNFARSESVEQAIELDGKTQQCWVKHRHRFVVDNPDTDFEKKTNRVLEIVRSILNL